MISFTFQPRQCGAMPSLLSCLVRLLSHVIAGVTKGLSSHCTIGYWPYAILNAMSLRSFSKVLGPSLTLRIVVLAVNEEVRGNRTT
jgi:hypothetical protein